MKKSYIVKYPLLILACTSFSKTNIVVYIKRRIDINVIKVGHITLPFAPIDSAHRQ